MYTTGYRVPIVYVSDREFCTEFCIWYFWKGLIDTIDYYLLWICYIILLDVTDTLSSHVNERNSELNFVCDYSAINSPFSTTQVKLWPTVGVGPQYIIFSRRYLSVTSDDFTFSRSLYIPTVERVRSLRWDRRRFILK